MDIKPKDLIFLVKDETAMSAEHLVEVEEYDKDNNIIKAKNVFTVHKMMQQDGSMGYGLAPGFFIISNKQKGEKSFTNNKEVDVHYINLNNFDVIGFVVNEDVLKAYKDNITKILLPDVKNTKGILGN